MFLLRFVRVIKPSNLIALRGGSPIVGGRLFSSFSPSPSSSSSSSSLQPTGISKDKDHDKEVERKFAVTPKNFATIEGLAISKAKLKTFTDRYYDFDSTYPLTRRDMWLRERNAVLELKWPMAMLSDQRQQSDLAGIDFYNESRDIQFISDLISKVAVGEPTVAAASSVTDLIKNNIFTCVAEVTTMRAEYEVHVPVSPLIQNNLNAGRDMHKFLAVVDRCFFPEDYLTGEPSDSTPKPYSEHSYTIGEIELISAGSGSSDSQAMRDIFDQLGVSHQAVRGKVLEYLHRHKPHHYAALGESGLLTSKLGPGTSAVNNPNPNPNPGRDPPTANVRII